MTDKKTVVVSAFPGTGKTHAAEHFGMRYSILDADSSSHSWIKPGVRNLDFPQNYVEYIKEQIGKYDIIFVSSHQEVRDALTECDMTFLIVHPLREDKEIYLQRYRDRGDNVKFIIMMGDRWDEFINSMYDYENYGDIAILLTTGAYISSYIDYIQAMKKQYA